MEICVVGRESRKQQTLTRLGDADEIAQMPKFHGRGLYTF